MSKSKTISDQEVFVRGDIGTIRSIIADLPEFAVIERFSFAERLKARQEELEEILRGDVQLSKTVRITLDLGLFDELLASSDDGLTLPQYIIKILSEKLKQE